MEKDNELPNHDYINQVSAPPIPTVKLKNKFKPIKHREYMLTDQCMWEPEPGLDYNPYDNARKPHILELVDKETGTVVHLKSGSIIRIVKAI